MLPGEQVGADPRRVEQMQQRMELVYAAMQLDDGLFFHANVMHRADQNRSPKRRRTVLFCYKAARNNPYPEHHHPFYTPLVKGPDSAVREVGVRISVGEDNFRRTFHNPPELARRLEAAAK